MIYTIYRRFITLNGKEQSYVGFTNKDPRYLTSETYRYSCPKFAKAINQYGWDLFELDYLDEAPTKKTAMNQKQKYVSKFNSIEDGFNISKTIGRRDVPILQFDSQGNIIAEYSSISEAANKTGVNQGNISSCCKGSSRIASAGGYVWKYKRCA